MAVIPYRSFFFLSLLTLKIHFICPSDLKEDRRMHEICLTEWQILSKSYAPNSPELSLGPRLQQNFECVERFGRFPGLDFIVTIQFPTLLSLWLNICMWIWMAYILFLQERNALLGRTSTEEELMYLKYSYPT